MPGPSWGCMSCCIWTVFKNFNKNRRRWTGLSVLGPWANWWRKSYRVVDWLGVCRDSTTHQPGADKKSVTCLHVISWLANGELNRATTTTLGRHRFNVCLPWNVRSSSPNLLHFAIDAFPALGDQGESQKRKKYSYILNLVTFLHHFCWHSALHLCASPLHVQSSPYFLLSSRISRNYVPLSICGMFLLISLGW